MFDGFFKLRYYQDAIELTKKEVNRVIAEDFITNLLWQLLQKSKSGMLNSTTKSLKGSVSHVENQMVDPP